MQGSTSASGRLTTSAWRIQILEEVERLEGRIRLAKLNEDRVAVVLEQLESARVSALRRRNPFLRPIAWFTGADIESSWLSIHSAKQELLMVVPTREVRAQVPMLRSKVKRYLSSSSPERKAYQDWLKNADRANVDPDRERIREIRTAVDRESDLQHANVRRFRNVLMGLSIVAIVLLGVFAAQPSEGWLDLCQADAAARGETGGDTDTTEQNADADAVDATEADADETDASVTSSQETEEDQEAEEPFCAQIWQIELMGGLGGLFAAAASLRRVPVTGEPYGLRRFQSLLKIPMGALTGLLGILLLQNDVIEGLEAQRGASVLVYAAIFGVSQQAVTRFADKRGKDLLTAGSADSSTDEEASGDEE